MTEDTDNRALRLKTGERGLPAPGLSHFQYIAQQIEPGRNDKRICPYGTGGDAP